MLLSRLVSNSLWPSSRLLIPAGIGIFVLFAPVGPPTLAGGINVECQSRDCDPDTPTDTPPSPPPVVEIEPDDRQSDVRYWAIQQCCRRIEQGLPLRGVYCSVNTAQQTLKECQPALGSLTDSFLQSFAPPHRHHVHRRHHHGATPAPLRIPILSQVLDLFGIFG